MSKNQYDRCVIGAGPPGRPSRGTGERDLPYAPVERQVIVVTGGAGGIGGAMCHPSGGPASS
ncbi:hypothetical protein [Streptomyces sp. NPDC005476]|uniref:hypothetical protein n=1 Tax=Streptomyces sp. NPDC005476 TaxID=3156882 RepID=UPI003455C47F